MIFIIKNLKKNSISPRLILNENYNAFVVGDNKIYVNTGLIRKYTSVEEIQRSFSSRIRSSIFGTYTK